MTSIENWNEWHQEYDDPSSELVLRMQTVRAHVAAVLDACAPGPISVVSICGGQGRELIGALESHPRRDDVRGRLVELDPDNAAFAAASAQAAGLRDLAIVNGDASQSDAYDGLAPVDLVVASGVWGHLDDADQRRTIGFIGQQLCAPGAAVVWTGFRRDPGRLERIRENFRELGFDEVVYDELEGDEYGFTVTTSRYRGDHRPFEPGVTLFTFGSSRRPGASGPT
jgi:hypothetical protein